MTGTGVPRQISDILMGETKTKHVKTKQKRVFDGHETSYCATERLQVGAAGTPLQGGGWEETER